MTLFISKKYLVMHRQFKTSTVNTFTAFELLIIVLFEFPPPEQNVVQIPCPMVSDLTVKIAKTFPSGIYLWLLITECMVSNQFQLYTSVCNSQCQICQVSNLHWRMENIRVVSKSRVNPRALYVEVWTGLVH